MKISQNLRKIRVNQTKLSQQEIADFLGVDRNTYANWEKGENDVKSEFIPKLAQVLGVGIEELFEGHQKAIQIMNNHYEGKDNSLLNGAVIIITNKQAVQKFADYINEAQFGK